MASKKGAYLEPNIWRNANGPGFLAVVDILHKPDSKGIRRRGKRQKVLRTLADARTWVGEQKAKSTLHMHTPGKCPTIGDVIDMSFVERKGLASYPQLEKYHQRFRLYFQNTPIDQIKRVDFFRFKEWLGGLKKESKGDGLLSETTVVRHVAELRNLLNWAEKNDIPEGFRAPNVQRVCKTQHHPRPLDVSLVDIWAVIKNLTTMTPGIRGGGWENYLPQAALVAIGLNTAARLSDVTHMEKTRFDRTKRVFYCRNSKARKDYIEIRCLDETLKVLDLYFEAHPENQTEYLVVNPRTSKPFDNLGKCLDRAIKAVGCPRFTFHNLKHAAVTALIEITKGDIDLVSRITGTSRVTLQNWYGHLASRHLPIFEQLEEHTRIAVGQTRAVRTPGKIIQFPGS